MTINNYREIALKNLDFGGSWNKPKLTNTKIKILDYFGNELKTNSLSRDHVWPKHYNGENNEQNIQIIDKKVNNEKGNKTKFSIICNDFEYNVEIHKNFLINNDSNCGIYYFKKVIDTKTKEVVLQNIYVWDYQVFKVIDGNVYFYVLSHGAMNREKRISINEKFLFPYNGFVKYSVIGQKIDENVSTFNDFEKEELIERYLELLDSIWDESNKNFNLFKNKLSELMLNTTQNSINEYEKQKICSLYYKEALLNIDHGKTSLNKILKNLNSFLQKCSKEEVYKNQYSNDAWKQLKNILNKIPGQVCALKRRVKGLNDTLIDNFEKDIQEMCNLFETSICFKNLLLKYSVEI